MLPPPLVVRGRLAGCGTPLLLLLLLPMLRPLGRVDVLLRLTASEESPAAAAAARAAEEERLGRGRLRYCREPLVTPMPPPLLLLLPMGR